MARVVGRNASWDVREYGECVFDDALQITFADDNPSSRWYRGGGYTRTLPKRRATAGGMKEHVYLDVIGREENGPMVVRPDAPAERPADVIRTALGAGDSAG